MFCPKCGNQNPDGAAFCGSCGSALTQQEIPAKPVEPPTPPPVNDPTAYAAPPEEAPSRAYEPAEYASTAGRETPPRSDAPKPKKPKKSPLVPILIACVAVLAAAVVVLAVFFLKDRKNVTVVTPEPADPSTEVKPTETLLPTEERPTIEVPTVRPGADRDAAAAAARQLAVSPRRDDGSPRVLLRAEYDRRRGGVGQLGLFLQL